MTSYSTAVEAWQPHQIAFPQQTCRYSNVVTRNLVDLYLCCRFPLNRICTCTETSNYPNLVFHLNFMMHHRSLRIVCNTTISLLLSDARPFVYASLTRSNTKHASGSQSRKELVSRVFSTTTPGRKDEKPSNTDSAFRDSDKRAARVQDAIAEQKDKQTRTPWHREGSNIPPVARQRSAGAMTKGGSLEIEIEPGC